MFYGTLYEIPGTDKRVSFCLVDYLNLFFENRCSKYKDLFQLIDLVFHLLN